MPTPIQKHPLGLLSLLGLVGKGQNPSQLADEVQAVVDIGSLYADNFTEIVTVETALINAPTTPVDLPIPAGEQWYMLAANAYAYNWSAAGGVQGLNLRLLRSGGNMTIAQGPEFTVAATSDINQLGFWFPTRWVALPGMSIRASFTRTSVPTATVGVRALFHRLRG